MSDPHKPKPAAAENGEKPKNGSPEALKVSERAAELSKLINSQLRHNFHAADAAEAQMPMTEREDAAYKLARREADLEHAKQVRASLQLTSPENSAALQEAKDNYHRARERYEQQAEVIARRTGTAITGRPGTSTDRWRDAMDWTYGTYKKGMSIVRHNPVVTLGALGAGAYGLSGLFTGPGMAKLGETLLAAVGQTGTGGALGFFVNGGLVTGAGALGYGVGKLVGKGIDEFCKAKFGNAIGAEKIGKYVGMLGGGLGTAAALGLTASSVAWSAGVPLAVYGGWKLGRAAYRYFYPPQKFNVDTAKTTVDREHGAHPIENGVDRLVKTYNALRGDPNNPILARLANVRQWAHGLTPVAGVDPHHTLAEVEAEWALVKADAERIIADLQKRVTDRGPEMQSAIAIRAQCEALDDRWDRLPLRPLPVLSTPLVPAPPALVAPVVPDMPEDVRAALTGVEEMIDNFESAAPRHTLKSIEEAYKAAALKFEAAWDKALERNNEVRKMNLLIGQAEELRTRWNSLPVPPALPEWPAENPAPTRTPALAATPPTPVRPNLSGTVAGALSGVDRMVWEFARETPAYSTKAIEDAFTEAKDKFDKAWAKAVQRSDDYRKAGTYVTRCNHMRQLWANLNPGGTPPVMPSEVNGALNNAAARIIDFVSDTPRFSADDVEEAFKQANDKFTKAWDKAVERTDQEIPERITAGAAILVNVQDVYADAGFTANNINHPAARKAYGLARSARTMAQTADTRLQAARTPEEARKQFEVLRAQEDIVRTQIEEAHANVERADVFASQAIAALGNINPADITAMRELPGQFQTMRDYVGKHQRDVAAADLRKAPSGDYERIWFGTGRTGGVGGNGRDIARTRQEIDARLGVLTGTGPWPKVDIQGLRTAFTAAVDPPDADGLSEFRPDLMKGVLDNADARLARSTQEAMAPLLSALTALRSAAGEGEAEIGLIATQCGNISGLPAPATLVPVLQRYLAH